MSVILLIQRAIAYLLEILGIVQAVQAGQAAQATAAGVAALEAEVKDIQLKINDSVIGLAALRDQLDLIYTQEVASFGTIEAALALVPKTGDTYPYTGDVSSGGANMTTDAIAEAVWVFRGPTTDDNAIDLLEDAAVPMIGQSQWAATLPFHQLGGWEYIPQTNIDFMPAPGLDVPTLDYSTIIASDATPVDWLNRIMGGSFISDYGGGTPGVIGSDSNTYYVPWLNTPIFLEMKRALGLTSSGATAPVWPGLAGVTLGTPVALSTGLTISEEMDGVIIEITSYPTKQGYFTFDTAISLRNIGALAFVTDDADEEFPQLLGFLNAVYCPKTMAHASGVVLRLSADVVGTITPWSLI